MSLLFELSFSFTLMGSFNLFLGIFALVQDRTSRLNQSFAAIQFSLFGWCLAIYSLFIPDPDTAVAVARAVISLAWVFVYSYIYFIHVLVGIEDQPNAKRHRQLLLFFLVLTYPIFHTPLVFQAIKDSTGRVFTESELAGPLYSLKWAIIALAGSWGCAMIFRHWRKSTGVLRNQMKYIMFMLLIGIGATMIRIFQLLDAVPWIYAGLMLCAYMCFAYAIFKHNLLDFNFWMRRLTIYASVYVPLTAIPFLLIPFLSGKIQSTYLFALVFLLYGVAFSMAPFLIQFFSGKAEQKKWAELNHQLNLILSTGQNLANETNLTFRHIADRFLETIQEVYGRRLNNPLDQILISVKNSKGTLVTSFFPNDDVPSVPMHTFRNLPFSYLQTPITRLDARRLTQSRHPKRISYALKELRSFFEEQNMEVMIPCTYHNTVWGVLFLGAKKNGIFSREELKALHASAAHVANAIRKVELLESNKKLKGLDQLKSDFISNITHEFKSPVHVIENAVQILLRNLSKPNPNKDLLNKYLHMIRNNNSQLTVFIQNLLEIAKIEKAQVNLKRIEAELNAVIEKAVHLFVPLAEAKGLRLHYKGCDSIVAELDIPKINQVLCNLISNAIKYTDKGEVIVSLLAQDQKAVISVKDTGIGLDPNNLPFLFQKFFQVNDSSASHFDGTGLGLAIAKGWVDAHGGRLWAETKGLGKGMTFFVELKAKISASSMLAPANQ